MENVSKALQIAGGVLIAVLVISLIVYGYSQLRKYQSNQDEIKQVQQVNQFNKKFEAYNGAISGYKLYSLTNLAIDFEEQEDSNVEIYMAIETPFILNTTLDNNEKSALSSQLKLYNSYITKLSKSGVNKMPDNVSNINSNDPKYVFTKGTYTTKGFFNYLFKCLNEEKQKAFKDKYFKCYDIKYNESNGKVIEMDFREIVKAT